MLQQLLQDVFFFSPSKIIRQKKSFLPRYKETSKALHPEEFQFNLQFDFQLWPIHSTNPRDSLHKFELNIKYQELVILDIK